ncbi:MAG: hypothetical protein J1E65_08060 [Lachnospiraceae bacterium]|nr:hypothetical protein [Lachnospiraceae bacterium]
MGLKTKIVCMGDSITEGFNISAEEAYPGQLQKLLGEDYLVVNKGVCSSCTLNVELDGEVMGYPYVCQDRYQEALLEKGDIYIIMLGTNDAQDGMDDVEDIRYPLHNMISRKADFVSCYQGIIDSVRRAAPEAVIYLNIPIPITECVWRKHQERYLQELMPCYEEILKQNPDIHKIDIHAAFEKLPKEELKALYLEDGLHPNPRGAELIAYTVYTKLKERY